MGEEAVPLARRPLRLARPAHSTQARGGGQNNVTAASRGGRCGSCYKLSRGREPPPAEVCEEGGGPGWGGLNPSRPSRESKACVDLGRTHGEEGGAPGHAGPNGDSRRSLDFRVWGSIGRSSSSGGEQPETAAGPGHHG